MDFYSLLKSIKKMTARCDESGEVCVIFSYDIRFNRFVIKATNYITKYTKGVTIEAFDFENLENDERRNQILKDIIENLIYDVTGGDAKL